ncbi:gliding motility-associated C-terminal domain-containing protein [Parapedobacter tibetensis]|uniref:gliding motility-associated C-terminal domain-containing protein n=1 Tax=Parapedobacter tibetensis TaxID=2972951 RepID=UPI00214DB73F|nr:gliding motility-associated C-terminal domain-containing protein [Parapedobacter tibetensis]
MAIWVTIALSERTMAQQGCANYGDPIINITFGTNVDPEFGAGTTTYIRNQNGQLNDGEYKLGNNINQGRGSWQHLPDHTGDQQGMMLIVNAGYEAGEFYRIRVPGLCEDTHFRFSAWIANANRPEECGGNPIPPNVRFVIEDLAGNVVSLPYATGNVFPSATPGWQEYGFEFETGGQTDFELVLINENPGGCGNDLAMDDIQFRPCGPEIMLNIDQPFIQGDTLFFCEDDIRPIAILGEIADEGYAANAGFQWQTRQNGQAEWLDLPNENGNTLQITPIANRWYRISAAAHVNNLSNQLCRILSDSIYIAPVIPQVGRVDTEQSAICESANASLAPPEFVGHGAGPLTYRWLIDEGDGDHAIPDANTPTYLFEPEKTGHFILKRAAVNICGDFFYTHTYEIDVLETIHTSFTLPQSSICMDDEPLYLTGGAIINNDGNMEGVYGGAGVVDGYFYPNIAGIGEHTLTFSPPDDVLCTEPSRVEITVHDTVYLHPMENMVMLPGQTVTLLPQTNATQFNWSDQPGLDNYHVQYPVASPSETTTYTLTAGNAAGCMKTETVTIKVLQNILVPNSFTPNGDGVNDAWEIDGLEDYPHVFIQVFNRWGSLVFSAKGYTVPWYGQFNGASLPVATYYYTLSSDVLEQPLSGSVTILK